jgi:hypothetical protein
MDTQFESINPMVARQKAMQLVPIVVAKIRSITLDDINMHATVPDTGLTAKEDAKRKVEKTAAAYETYIRKRITEDPVQAYGNLSWLNSKSKDSLWPSVEKHSKGGRKTKRSSRKFKKIMRRRK